MVEQQGYQSAIYRYWNLIQRMREGIDKRANHEVKNRNGRNQKQGIAVQSNKQRANTCCSSLLHKKNKTNRKTIKYNLTAFQIRKF